LASAQAITSISGEWGEVGFACQECFLSASFAGTISPARVLQYQELDCSWKEGEMWNEFDVGMGTSNMFSFSTIKQHLIFPSSHLHSCIKFSKFIYRVYFLYVSEVRSRIK
jgi:hypothetical protein